MLLTVESELFSDLRETFHDTGRAVELDEGWMKRFRGGVASFVMIIDFWGEIATARDVLGWK